MTAVRTEQVRVRLTPEELHTIRRRAERDGRTVSGYLRRLGVTGPQREEREERADTPERIEA
jgi:hypothetical protein